MLSPRTSQEVLNNLAWDYYSGADDVSIQRLGIKGFPGLTRPNRCVLNLDSLSGIFCGAYSGEHFLDKRVCRVCQLYKQSHIHTDTHSSLSLSLSLSPMRTTTLSSANRQVASCFKTLAGGSQNFCWERKRKLYLLHRHTWRQRCCETKAGLKKMTPQCEFHDACRQAM